jgi:glycerophosphoryl diester phosphodiesterase
MGKKTKLAVAIAAASAAAWAGSKAVAKPQKREQKEFFQTDRPLFFAHHGGSHIAPSHTLPAFEQSVAFGVDGFTVCVRLTKDEEIILYHDEKIDASSNGIGYIKDLTLHELNEFNHGVHFTSLEGESTYANEKLDCLTLQDVLKKYPTHLFIIEIKDGPDTYEGSLMPSKLWRLIEELHAENRVIVTSEYNEQTDRFNLYARNSVALAGTDSDTKKALATYTSQFGHLYNPKVDALITPCKAGMFVFDSPKFGQFLNNLNVSLLFKDVNDLPTMNKLVRTEAKGIITDRPDIAAVLLKKWL